MTLWLQKHKLLEDCLEMRDGWIAEGLEIVFGDYLLLNYWALSGAHNFVVELNIT